MDDMYLEIYKNANFYNTFGKDSLILSILFKYKPYYIDKIPETVCVSFQLDDLQNVCNLLETKDISYVVYNTRSFIVETEFSSQNNKYDDYIKLVNTRLQSYNMKYNDYVKKLKHIYMKNNFSNQKRSSGNNIIPRRSIIKINSPAAQVNDTCEILFDGEIEPTSIKIRQSIPVYSPTWTGNHDQNSRRISNVEYKSNADFSKGEISSESPLAKAIIGKPVRTRFHYKVNDNIVSGIILKTYK